jgi:hypothetical protein
MKNHFRPAAISLGMLLVTVGCNDNPPAPESPQPGPAQPAPNESQTFPGTNPSQGTSEPESSESSSLDFDSRNTPDRYASEQSNPSASQGFGAGMGDAPVTGDALSGFDSTNESAETPFSNPLPAADASEFSLSDQPDAEGEAK